MKTQTPITAPGLAWAIGQIHKQFEKALAPKPKPTLSIDMTVQRDFRTVPIQVSFDKDGSFSEAWVTADSGALVNGESIELTLEEQTEASDLFTKEFPTCTMCKGDGECWITEDQANVDCPYCGGRGFFLENKRPQQTST
jgi:DNA-directed RNA polymerase subunit RPC12/RpoP